MSIKWISPSKKVLCPYCYWRFHLSDMIFRDETDPNNKVPDARVVSVFFQNRANLAKSLVDCPEEKNPVFPWHIRVLRKTPFIRRCFVVRLNGKTFGKGQKRYAGCCPHCGLRIPATWCDGDFADKTISIIGLKSSGKTCYLVELIRELENRSVEVGYGLTSFDTVKLGTGADLISYVDSALLYGDRYKEDELPGDTYAIRNGNQQIRIPLIYRINYRGKKADLFFYDPAGEDVGSEEFYKKYYYATRASGVIFLVDPFSYEGVRTFFNQEYSVKDARSPIDALYKLYLANGKLVKNKIAVPCAVVLSKFDRFREKPELAPLLEGPNVLHKGGYNLHYYEARHERLNEFLTQRSVPLASNALKNVLEDYRLFAVSAVGGKPECKTDKLGNEKFYYPRNPVKFGVVAPVFWLLYKFGVLPKSQK